MVEKFNKDFKNSPCKKKKILKSKNMSAEWQIFKLFSRLVVSLHMNRSEELDCSLVSQQRETKGHCYRKAKFFSQDPLKRLTMMISWLPEIPKLIRLFCLKSQLPLKLEVPKIHEIQRFISHLNLSINKNVLIRPFSRNKHQQEKAYMWSVASWG